MTGRGDGKAGAAGGPARHVPVLLGEVREALALRPGGVYLDGTFGAGGYARAILDSHADVRLVAVDRDPDAIRAGAAMVETYKGRLDLVAGRFGDLDEIVEERDLLGALDGVVLDIGVSSMQIDEAGRGFSFRFEGPLDMRMEQAGRSAADIVNGAPEAELADIFYHYGEERRARAVARAIIEHRRRSPILTTRELADLVAGLVRAEPNGPHPATRVFQALRIAVNDELGELVRALTAAERALKPGGRLVVVTFHSLEDRIVKQFLAGRTGRVARASRHMPSADGREAASFTAVTRGPVLPSDTETFANPRARSAKLRAGERTSAPPQKDMTALEALAALPRTAEPRGGRR
jgi:16S rRNA (cytosine1402-N4)-methyltransferase